MQPEIETTTPRCLACGSERVISGANVADHESGGIHVSVYGNPDAMLFRDALWGQCTAQICGDCGHVELHVANHRELFDHYLRSQTGE